MGWICWRPGIVGTRRLSHILSALQAALASLDNFETDFPSHQAEFLPFLTNYLIGVDPDVLDAPLAHLHTSLSVFAPLE